MKTALHWVGIGLLACGLMLTSVRAADDGERPLFVVHFTTGPQWQPDLPPGEQNGFKEHGANLGRLRQAGQIRFGARYGDYGMIILAADDIDTARAELDADPGVEAGIFTYEVAPINVFYPWREASGD